MMSSSPYVIGVLCVELSKNGFYDFTPTAFCWNLLLMLPIFHAYGVIVCSSNGWEVLLLCYVAAISQAR